MTQDAHVLGSTDGAYEFKPGSKPTPFDANGNPDVMGSRDLTPSQAETANMLKAEYNALYARISGTPQTPADAARLFAVARTLLEQSCMAAVKAVSRT
jgi:hypothetical protein